VIPFANARFFGRRVRVHRRYTDHVHTRIVFDGHAQSTIAPVRATIELLEVARCQQLAVWIVQLSDESLRCFLVDIRRWKRIDEAIAHERHDLLEQQRTFALLAGLKEKTSGDNRDQ